MTEAVIFTILILFGGVKLSWWWPIGLFLASLFLTTITIASEK